MKKQINIDGMSCNHCVRHVQDALSEIAGVREVNVNLKGKNAVVELDDNVTDSALKNAVEDAGYDVVSITNI